MQRKELIKLTIFGCVCFLLHYIINYLLTTRLPLLFICLWHLTLFITLLISNLYIIKKMQIAQDKIWINYVVSSMLRYILFLFLLYFYKEIFNIQKNQVLIHVFIWFFAYLTFEITQLTKEIKKINT